eukprot:1007701_1
MDVITRYTRHLSSKYFAYIGELAYQSPILSHMSPPSTALNLSTKSAGYGNLYFTNLVWLSECESDCSMDCLAFSNASFFLFFATKPTFFLFRGGGATFFLAFHWYCCCCLRWSSFFVLLFL